MNHSRSKALLLGLFLTFGLALGDARAQAVYGSLSGTVTDAQGAVVAKAKVTVTSVERKTSDTVETNDSGIYTKERLLPGNYEIKVEVPNFKTATVPSVTVRVDTQTNADVALETGQVTENVTVSAEGTILKTDRADVATTLESRQITETPILDRNFTRFVLLTPGAQQLATFQHAASENPQGSVQTQVNGQHFSGTGYQLDGTDNRDPILGIIVINPNFEAIGESKITSQNYDAEFGQATAGVVSVQTKSGTNNLRGTLFAFRQNDEFQARNPFSQAVKDSISGKFIPDTVRTQFGAAVGGRIITDKLFFFTDYQGTRSKIGGSRILTVPTALARTGNLSEYATAVYDPASNGVVGSRTQFAGNIIPTARLSTQATNLLRLIPLPNRPGLTNNYSVSGSEVFDNDTFDVRIDGRVSERFNTFGRYSYAKYERTGPAAFGAGGGRELVSLAGTSSVRNQSLAYGFDYTLNNTTLVDFRFGLYQYKVAVLPSDFGKATSREAGIPGLNLDDTFTSGLSGFFINDPFGFNFGTALNLNRCNCPLDQNEKQFQLVGNLSKQVGNHSLKFGVDVRRAYNLRVPSDQHRSGELRFQRERTSNGTSGTGLALASFLLGDVSSFGRYVSTSTDARERQWRHYYYGQDKWQATSKLSLSYGLRLEAFNPQTLNKAGNGGFLDLATGEIRVAGVGGIKLNGNVQNSANLAPRLAAAYQVNQKTVIRAGYGRSYDIGVFGSLFGHSVTQNLPVLAAQSLNPANNTDRVFTLAQGPTAFTNFFGITTLPNRCPGGNCVANTAIPSSGRFFLPDGVFTRALPEKQRPPAVEAYNVTFQYQLPKNMSLEVAYVGNKGTHVFAGEGPAFNINQPTLQGFTTGLNQNQRKPFFNRFGWTQGIDFFCNCADSRYDSLQTKVEKRFSDGYSLLAHYTLARTVQEDGDYFIYSQDLNRGPQPSDRKHSFTLTNLFELPVGRGKMFLTDASKAVDLFFGGWQLNQTTSISSGLPFNVTYDANGIIDVGPNRPNVNGDVQTGGSRDAFFNVGAFSRPAVGTFGNLKRNALRGPGFWRTDASLLKNFRFTETKSLEFRLEVVNLFNHVNLDVPSGFIGSFNAAGTLVRDSNAGRILGTLGSGIGFPDPQRNLQFAFRFKF